MKPKKTPDNEPDDTPHPPRPLPRGVVSYQVKGLSGEYTVLGRDWVDAETAAEVVRALEYDGKVPFRSLAKGGGAVEIAAGGGGMYVKGRLCDVMVLMRTVGIFPLSKEQVEEAEREMKACAVITKNA